MTRTGIPGEPQRFDLLATTAEEERIAPFRRTTRSPALAAAIMRVVDVRLRRGRASRTFAGVDESRPGPAQAQYLRADERVVKDDVGVGEHRSRAQW